MVSTMVIGPGSVNFSLRARVRAGERAPPWRGRDPSAAAAPSRSAPSPCSGRCGCPFRRAVAKSMPSTFSRKPWTKCWRDCSPSVTMSMPASSCSLMAKQRRVALGGVKLGAGEPPRGPQLVRVRQARRVLAGCRRSWWETCFAFPCRSGADAPFGPDDTRYRYRRWRLPCNGIDRRMLPHSQPPSVPPIRNCGLASCRPKMQFNPASP